MRLSKSVLVTHQLIDPSSTPHFPLFHTQPSRCTSGTTREPAATRALYPQVWKLEEWLQSDGLALIDRMAYEEGWGSRVHDALMCKGSCVRGLYKGERIGYN
jgi:hypothetical protein